jgi:phosphatidylserine/phosphatidylglycerophosphate/cardiolipin synthase-like enzyme
MRTAFHCHTPARVQDPTEHRQLEMVLKHHPRTLAYRESVSRLKGRHHNKDVVIDDAIALRGSTPIPY